MTLIGHHANFLDAFKTYFAEVESAQDRAFNKGAAIESLLAARATATDIVLRHLWRATPLYRQTGFTLIAVGGYGRGELHPGSDVDILILTSRLPEEKNKNDIANFITNLWDIGLAPGHAVRTLEETIELSKNDITVITNLVDARFIIGDEQYFNNLIEAVAPSQIWSGEAFYTAKKNEQKQRHLRFHSTSYSLEPNLKESPGGLRDIQTVTWIAKRQFQALNLLELTHLGIFSIKEYRILSSCMSFLSKVRYALHRVAGRAEERLLFDYQRRVAQKLGYEHSDHNTAVEVFMKKYFRVLMQIRDLNDLLLQVFEQEIVDDYLLIQPHVIDHQFQVRNQHIEVTNNNVFKEDSSALLKIFLMMVKTHQVSRMSPSTLRLITLHKRLIDENFRQDPINQQLFLELFRTEGDLAQAFTLLKRSGVLSAYLPSFAKISGQMQFDMFHVYTVDEHTLFLLRNIAHFTHPSHSGEFPLCQSIMNTTPYPELVYLGALFHDIAKGRGGDHSELGALDAREFCQQHQLAEEQVEIVEWLVANHLIMSTTAQKRDITDPEVIDEFTQKVKTKIKLDLLYVLTVADIRATNPSLWNSWKDALLQELYQASLRRLMAGSYALSQSEQITQHKNTALEMLVENDEELSGIEDLWGAMDDSYFLNYKPEQIAWHTHAILNHTNSEAPLVTVRTHPNAGGTEIFVYVLDQSFMFAAITTFLATQNLNILAASIHTTKNRYCLDSFVVLGSDEQPLTSNQEIQFIIQRLTSILENIEQAPLSFQQHTSRAMKTFNVMTKMIFRDDEPSEYTTLELIALDQAGLLSIVSQAFIENEIRLHSAKIVTLGEKVEDIFTISDRQDNPITDKSLRQQIVKTIQSRMKSEE